MPACGINSLERSSNTDAIGQIRQGTCSKKGNFEKSVNLAGTKVLVKDWGLGAGGWGSETRTQKVFYQPLAPNPHPLLCILREDIRYAAFRLVTLVQQHTISQPHGFAGR